ncbi:MAG: OmpA family protein [Saprospiraceae bacterium]
MKRYIPFANLLFLAFYTIAQPAITNLGLNINTEYDETAPMISPDGKTLYFVRKGDTNNNGKLNEADIWLSNKQPDDSWSRAINAGTPLNNRFANRVVSIIPSGHQLYLINVYKKADSRLALSHRTGRTWSFPEVVQIDSTGNPLADIDYHINSWGNIMVLSMARGDALGQRDLYVSIKKQDGQWSTPKHMGDIINSNRQEGAVFLALDGKTLYFSSNGHGGLGGMDLFVSRRLDETWTNWSKPENLGNQINSKENDIYISLPAQGNPAYIVRQEVDKNTDIYAVNLVKEQQPNPVVLVHGQVLSALDHRPVIGPKDVINVNSPQAISSLEGKDNQFKLIVPYGEEVSLHTQVEGYYPVSPPLAFGEAKIKEDLDFDSRNILASSSLSQGYYQRDEDIAKLSLQLDGLKQDLEQLEKSRQEYRSRLAQERKSGTALAQTDPALDALRHKYANYLFSKQDTVPSNKGSKKAKSDKELEDMKARFRSHYKIKDDKAAPSSPPSRYLPSTTEKDRFDSIKDSIALELKSALKPKVTEELKKEFEGEVRKEVANDMEEPSKKFLTEETKEWELHLNNSLKGKDISTKGISPPPARELADWEKQLGLEIKSALKPEVESDLRNALKEDVKEAIREEATYFAKKKRTEEVESALQQRILQQIKEEERQTEPSLDIPSAYEAQVLPLQPPTYKEIEQDLLLVPATAGQTIPLHHIYFNPNTSKFKPTAYTELERVVLFLQKNKKIKIEIGAHTNGWLSHSQSTQLSKQRAKAVTDYLMSQGIEAGRVTYKGYGKIKPIATNDTIEGRRLNQRIEMKILE